MSEKQDALKLIKEFLEVRGIAGIPINEVTFPDKSELPYTTTEFSGSNMILARFANPLRLTRSKISAFREQFPMDTIREPKWDGATNLGKFERAAAIIGQYGLDSMGSIPIPEWHQVGDSKIESLCTGLTNNGILEFAETIKNQVAKEHAERIIKGMTVTGALEALRNEGA